MGLWEHLTSVPEPKKSGSQRWAYLLLYFSGVLYPQMRPPTKQASRFRSTARTSRPSLTSWDLVWPLVFKLLCHVSSNWYLMFSLLPPLTSTSSLLHFILCLSPKPSPASTHYLCVTESGAKSNRWFTLWGKSAVKVLNETTSFFLDTWNRRNYCSQGILTEQGQVTIGCRRKCILCLSEPKETQTTQQAEISGSSKCLFYFFILSLHCF